MALSLVYDDVRAGSGLVFGVQAAEIASKAARSVVLFTDAEKK